MKKNTLDRFYRLTPEDKDRIYQEVIDNCERVADCWVWKGPKSSDGYGLKYIAGKMRVVSRFVLAYVTRESYANELQACHIGDCAYRSCCNPRHLKWDTQSENCKERERQDLIDKQSRLREQPGLYPQPALGDETHEQHELLGVDIQTLATLGVSGQEGKELSTLVS